MARVDKIIDFMTQMRGQRFTMQNERNCYLYRGDAGTPLNQVMTAAEIEKMVAESAPSELVSQLAGPAVFRYEYDAKQGSYIIRVEKTEDSISVSIAEPGAIEPETQRAAEPEPAVAPPSSPEPEHAAPAAPEAVSAGAPEPVSEPSVPVTPVSPTVTPIPAPSAPVAAAGMISFSRAPGLVADDELPAATDVNPADLTRLFDRMIEAGASDLHLSSSGEPMVRIDSIIRALPGEELFDGPTLKGLLWSIAPAYCREEYRLRRRTNFAYDHRAGARMRCTVYADRRGIAAAFRLVPLKVPTPESLGVPERLVELALRPRGLILVVGSAGSGKTTTTAALTEYINQNREGHIITIDHPIEFVFQNRRSLVHQLEVGVHVESYADGLRSARREDPDVCVVGEIPDADTFESVLTIAETGRLVIGTLYAPSAITALGVVVDQFPPERQREIRARLTAALLAVSNQLLLCRADKGRVAAFELLLNTAGVVQGIVEANTQQIEAMLQTGGREGMIRLNDSLVACVKAGQIAAETAYEWSRDRRMLKEQFDEAGIVMPVTG